MDPKRNKPPEPGDPMDEGRGPEDMEKVHGQRHDSPDDHPETEEENAA